MAKERGGAAEASTAPPGRETALSELAGRAVEAALTWALVVTPLLLDVQSARPLEPLKALFVGGLATLVVLALVVRALERRPLRWSWPREPLVGAALALALAGCLSTALALTPRLSFFGSPERASGLLALLGHVALGAGAWLCLRSRASVERVLGAAIVASVPVALVGLAQRYGLDPLGMLQDPRRVGGTFGAPNFAGSYAAFLLPLTLARGMSELAARRGPAATCCGFAAALQALLLVFTQSRGPLLGAVAGSFVLVLGLFLARRRRRAALLWIAAGAGAVLGLALLNVRGTPLDVALDPLRRLPLVGRLAKSGATEGGSVKVRLLIWSAALELARPREPLGIPGDALAPPDPRNALRPLVGYGADSLKSVFPSVEPPELAHLEQRGSVADRAHNEGLDALVMHGALGLVATYAFWCALIARAVRLAGWLRDRAERRRLALCAAGGAAAGAALALLARGPVLLPLGLPLGALAGTVLHLAIGGLRERAVGAEPPRELPALELGLLGALVAHLVQIQLVFPIAATHALLWISAGIIASLGRAPERVEPARDPRPLAEGLAVGAAVAALCFAYLRAGGAPAGAQRPLVLATIMALTWGVGLALTGRGAGVWRHAAGAASGLAILALAPAVRAGGALTLFALLLLQAAWMACALASGAIGRAPRRWLAHVPEFALAAWLLASWTVAPLRAGVALEDGRRAALAGDWPRAVALHERARALDPGLAPASTALASDWQGAALDPRTPAAERARAWERGEAAALAAWRASPYDADGPTNLGRYLYTRADAGEPARFAEALAAFEDALALAPRHVELHALAARTLLAMDDPAAASALLERALALDPGFAEGRVLAGDAWLARGELDRALEAHEAAFALARRGDDGLAVFLGDELDRRLEAYSRLGGTERLVQLLEQLASERPGDPRIPTALERCRRP